MNEEPKRPTPEREKFILAIRERMKRKEFARDIVERFPKSAFYDHCKLSCGHWSSSAYISSGEESTTCFQCIDEELEKEDIKL
jgi:hypothetical protein